MNRQHQRIEAVVISITPTYWLLSAEGNPQHANKVFIMSEKSTNISGPKFPRMRETVTILQRCCILDEDVPHYYSAQFVNTFDYKPSGSRKYMKQEVLAVAEVKTNYITLVAMSSDRGIHACVHLGSADFRPGQLVFGDLVELPRCVHAYTMEDKGTVEYRRNCVARQNSTNLCEVEHTAGVLYAENIRLMTSEEEQLILTRCAHLPNIELQQAKRYIQEPLIAVRLFQKYIVYKEVMKNSVSVFHEDLGTDEAGVSYISFYITTEVHDTISRCGSDMWKKGKIVQVAHEQLASKGSQMTARMVIRNVKACRSGCRVKLCSTEKYHKVLTAAFRNTTIFTEKKFFISPAYDDYGPTLKALRESFDEFFLERRQFFDLCIGRGEKPTEIYGNHRMKAFFSNGKLLDSNQLDFVLKATAIPGFVCANAPPGCGKTLTTVALLSHLEMRKVSGGICISGTTRANVNSTVTAARGERIMDDWIKNYEFINKDEVNKNKKQLEFFASSTSVLIRRTDIFRGTSNEEAMSIRRLILEDAEQLSSIDAMALYCSFPRLEFITFLGDMKQGMKNIDFRLRGTSQDTLSYKLAFTCEMEKVWSFTTTTTKQFNTMYRCHPSITEKFLIPIYGPQMKSGVSTASRSLAKDYGLLIAKDESPCVLIDVDVTEEYDRNIREMNTTLDLIYDIVVMQQVPVEDVVVICYYKAQMSSLEDKLKDKGSFGPLKIHTVDSFQGQEAKVVILLTTKNLSQSDDGKKMRFVGDAARGAMAVSRAQHALYIFGHWQSLAKTEFWAQFLRNMIVAGGIVNRYFGETDIIPKLRNLIKFSIHEKVKTAKVEIIEPQIFGEH